MGEVSKISKADMVGILQDIAALLEYRQDNPFKIKAYDTAARALAAEQSGMDELLAPGRLELIKGIGKGIAEIIRTAADDGYSQYHKELLVGTPSGIHQLLRIPNLGVKKIKTLHEKLGIQNLEELEVACNNGSLEPVKGLGKKTAERIAAGILQYRRSVGRTLYYRAVLDAEPLIDSFSKCRDMTRYSVAGSLRRYGEVIGNINIVAESNQPEKVIDFFVSVPQAFQVLFRGSNKATVGMIDDIQAELVVVSEEEYATSLHYYTGSVAHNSAMRYRALKMGYRINEYGVFRLPPEEAGQKVTKKTAEKYDESVTGSKIPTHTEEDVFKALGLRYILPELREGMGEVEAAEWNELPKLVTMRDYRGVVHCHSTWSDGLSSIGELARSARDDWKLEYIAICDHSEVASYAGGIKKDDLAAQQAEIDEVNSAIGRDTFRVLKSCECDILVDGTLDYPEEYLARMDLVVASVHSRFQLGPEQMTERLMHAMDNPYMTILGHMSGRLLLSRDPYGFDMETVLRKAAATGTVIEINADPHRLDLDWRYCRRAKELGIKFAVNPDAHSAQALACIEFGINTARKGWLTKDDIVNCQGLAEFLATVKKIRDGKLARKK